MNTKEFNNILSTQEFVDFQFSFMPIGEVPAGKFVCYLGTFFQILGRGEDLTRIENLRGEIKLIANSTKVSAICNY